MPLINCKVELKLEWTKYCALSIARNENDIINNSANNKISTINNTKVYGSIVTLLARDNKKLSKFLSNRNTINKTNKNATDEFRYFIESINCLFQFIQIMATRLKDLKLKDITYQNAWSKIIMRSSLEKGF